MIEPTILTESNKRNWVKNIFLIALFAFASTTLFASDYFWVGNSGNWNDNAHWSLSSGGNGGVGIPTANDNVHFDENSFTVNSLVQINSAAFCGDFTWSGNNSINKLSGSGNIEINGSLIVDDRVDLEYNGNITLLGNGDDNIIRTLGVLWKSDFVIHSNSEYTLESNFVSEESNKLYLEKGTLNTAGEMLYFGSFETRTNNPKHLELSTSQVVIHERWDVESGSNFTMNAGQSDISLLETMLEEEIKKGDFDYNLLEEKALCGLPPVPIEFVVHVISDYFGANISCTGVCDAIIYVEIISGVGPYGFEVDDGTTTTLYNNDTITGLCAGPLVVTVIDNGQLISGTSFWQCSDATTSIPAPFPLYINVITTIPPTCPGDCDGGIVADIGGGTPGLHVEWPGIAPFPYVGAAPIGIVCEGSWEVIVIDTNDCVKTEVVQLVGPPPIIIATVADTVSCHGECDGQISATASGGNGYDYVYLWDGGDTPNDSLGTGFCEFGIHTVTVTDPNGCVATATDSIPLRDSITITATVVSNPTCFGFCDGEISIGISGGCNSYMGIVFAEGPLGGGIIPFTPSGGLLNPNNFCANTLYKVYVTDVCGCTDSLQLPMLTEPAELIMSVTDSTDLLCAGDANGSVDILTGGGTPGYTHEWTVVTPGGGEITANEDQFTLDGGCYQVVATDFLGCTDTLEVCVFEPDSIYASGTVSDNLCWDDLSAAIDQTTTGGMGPGEYTFTWTGPTGFFDPGTEDLMNLDSGCYTVNIIDTNLCSIDTTYCVVTPGEIYVDAAVINADCNGASTGSIDITPVNGVGPYVFDWSHLPPPGYVDPEDVGGLAQGAYTVSIMDDNGCVVDSIINISEPTPISGTLTPSNSSCGASNGSVVAVISGGTPPGTYQWFDGAGNPVGLNSSNLLNVPADCYDLVYTDVNGCTFTDQACVIDDLAPTGTFITQDLSCFQSCDGSINSTITLGTLPYAVSWTSTDPGFTDPGTGGDIFGLCAADYTITVVDANGCIFSQAITIAEPDPVSAGATVVVTDVPCFGDSTGAIDISPMGGTVAGAYIYSWTGVGFTAPTEDVSNLAPGQYCVNIMDDNGCSIDTCMTVNEPTQISLSYTSVNAQCLTADGQATVSASGGTTSLPPPLYSYAWTPGGAISPTVTGLAAGAYTVVVTDDNTCSDSIVVTISEDGGPSIVIDSVYDVSCNGVCDGAVETTVTGANPFTLSWSSVPAGFSSSAGDITGLCAGTYVLSATDDVTTCQVFETVVITEPDVYVVPGVVTDPTCFGGTGVIDITPTGGTGPYNFNWDNDGTTDSDTDPEDLSGVGIVAGAYDVIGYDANGCISNGSFTIIEPTEITYVTSNTPTSICGVCDGTVTALAADGTPGVAPNEYSYDWYEAGTLIQVGNTATVAGLCAGCYDVVITDGVGCTVQTSECVSDGGAPALTATGTDVTCFGDVNGTITVTLPPPANQDSLVWTGPQVIADETNPAIGLMPGTYTAQLTDDGCISATTVDVLEPLEITLSPALVNPDCAGSTTGEITITINNAIGVTGLVWTGPTAIPDDTNPALGLTAGVYCVTVTDANGCTATRCDTLFDNPTIAATTSSLPTDCDNPTGQVSVVGTGGVIAGDYNYLWDDIPPSSTPIATGLGAGTYTVIVSDDLGCTDIVTATVITVAGPTVTLVSQSDVTCFGANDGSIFVDVTGGTGPGTYTYLWSPSGSGLEDLVSEGPGYDTLTVTDAAGCTATLSDSILEPALLSVTGIETDLSCNNDASGAINITVAGGTGPFTFAWTNSAGTPISANEDINGLSADTYDVVVADANGCTATYSGTLAEPTAIALTTGLLNSTCLLADGAVSVAPTGGTGPYTYDWQDVASPGLMGINNDTLANITAGAYEGFVTDASGCQDSVTIAVSDATGPTLTYTVTNVVCYGNANGAIDITTAAVGPTFNWTGPLPFAGAVTEDISGVEAGTYTVSITNSSGCIVTEVIVIGGPTGPIATTAVIADLTCYNDASGAIDVTTTGGTPSVLTGYTFAWSGPNGFTSTFEDIALLDSGAYDLIVTDSNACNYSVTYNITQPDSIAITPTVVDATCGLADGSISTAVTGGDGNYTYAWTDLTGGMVFPGSNPSEGNLSAGVYEIVVTDGAGCSNLVNVPVTDANGATLTTVVVDVDCNGNANGSITLTVNGPNTYTYAWTGPAPFTATTPNISGLSPGTYNVLVEDQVLGCFSAATIDIIEPSALTISALDTSLSCFASLDGSIDITVGGGTPGYSYLWTFPNASTSTQEDLTALDTGVYQVTTTDLSGCTIAAQYTITQPNSMVLSSVVTDDNCFQGGNGAIDITVTQGTTPYTYNWSWTGNTSNNEDIAGLFADTYSLSIVDSNGCQKDTTFIITEATQIIADVTVVDANCNFSDGSAVSNTSGGAGGYIYSWGSNSIINQPSGVYPLTINDANGCQLDTTITINDIGGPTITIVNVLDASCFGASDGGVDASVSGATAPYTYFWNPIGSQVEDLTNAPAGVYTYQVTDALGCSSFETATINSPSEITASYTTVDATCGICNGEATVTASGGTPGYAYIWSGNQTTAAVTGLCAGVQTVQITDFNNCVSNIDVAVSSDAPGTASVLTTDVTCGGGNDGTAEAVPVGGASPFTYFWPHNGSTANPITGLSAGNYFVEVSDANGCVHVVEAIISESTVITSTVLITPSTCGGSDGAISTTVSGGSGVYTYDWSPLPDVTPDINNQPEGIYTVVIDDGACSITEIYTIPGIGAPEVSLTTVPTNCYNDNTGSIFSTVTPNVGVTYEWFDNTGSIGFTSDIVNTLAPGTYTLEVFDPGTGCYAYATGVVTAPDSIVLSIPTIIDASCAGVCDGEANVVASGGTLPYTYVWTGNGDLGPGPIGLCAGADTVTITDLKFCTLSTEVIVNEPFAIAIVIDSVTDAFCVNTNDGEIFITTNGGDGNYTYSWVSIPAGFTGASEDPIGLLPMDYEVSITDGNGCIYIDTIPVDTLNVLIANAGVDSSVCEGSCINLNGTATGTSTFTLEWFDVNGSIGVMDTVQICPTTLGTGSYVLVATDLSCTYSDTVDVLVNPLPIVDAGPDYYEVFGTIINLGGSPTGTSGTYQWSPTTNFTDPLGTDANPELMVNSTLDYIVTVTDSNGCVNSDTANVEIFPEIVFPNGFSPNNDGINDTWQIDNMIEFPEAVIEVYNRWGQQLFMSVGYVQEFDGTHKGQDLPVGTYYYIITLNHPEYPDAYTGPITIMR